MEDKLQTLKRHLARATDLYRAAQLLSWDQETMMPPGGVQARADQYATLVSLYHEYSTQDEIGALLEDLAPYADQLDYDSDEASIIRFTRREYERLRRIPNALAEEIARMETVARDSWMKARSTANFRLFEPDLAHMVDLQIQRAECYEGQENIYDPLLDYFEPGMTQTKIAAVFAGLKPELVKLVGAIAENLGAVDDSVLRREYDEAKQWDFCLAVAAQIGYDFQRGRLDKSAHPFTIHFSMGDVRITTRLHRDRMASALMSTIHESGHAMYEQGVSPALYRTMLAEGASMAVHESQSRFYENNLGRSRGFWKHFYPKLQAHYAPMLDGVPLETFYRALNKVEPSFIRVEADEVTYGLHIILRFEIENELINGRTKVKDLPAEWNARMEQYLGVVPPDDAKGVLQDIHWSMGLIGYFPDYLLGSLFAVQLYEQAVREQPAIPAEVETGQVGTVNAWMREKIHRHGRKFTLPELAERVTGGPLKWEPYMAYLNAKYGEIYGL
jgi:carboxypeptidase Taq